MKNSRRFFSALHLTLLASILILGYVNCSNDVIYIKQSSGTIGGNPMAPASNKIVFGLCGVINRCNSQVTVDECREGLMKTAGFNAPLGLAPQYSTLESILNAESSGAINGNALESNGCYSNINSLDCADPQVQAAYDASLSNPFISSPQMISTTSCGLVFAPTVTAASCSHQDVQTAIDSASDGDIVTIPPGVCTWTTPVVIDNKILKLQGAGVGQTVLTDGISKAPFPNIPQMLVWKTKDGGASRLTGITFNGGTIPDINVKGMILIGGDSHQLRIDHCKFVPTQTGALYLGGNLWGVIDHNVFDISGTSGWGVIVHHDSWNVPGSLFGDASWADAGSLGTSRAIFVEDNVFQNDQSVIPHRYANDGLSGGRVVYRYNSFVNTTWASEGTATSGRWRGLRQFEIYNNSFSLNAMAFPSFVGIGSGTGVVFNNTATLTGGSTVNRFADNQYYRTNASYAPFGRCDGSSPWDGNQTSGYPCLDQPGRGSGNLISGDTPGPVAWPNQTADPIYCWNNSIDGSSSGMVTITPSSVAENRDFFNGTARPAYTPFVYPHPLVK